MSLDTSKMAEALDEGLKDVTHVQWSEDGDTETSNLERTAVSLTDATDADPSVSGNDSEIVSAKASGSCTITHFAFAGGTDGDTRHTTWNELDASKSLAADDKLYAEAGDLVEKLHQSDSEPE